MPSRFFLFLCSCLFRTALISQDIVSPSALPPRLMEALQTMGYDAGSMSVAGDYTFRGIRHLHLQQNHLGIPIFNGISAWVIDGTGELQPTGQRIIPSPAGRVRSFALHLSPEKAIEAAAASVGLSLRSPAVRLDSTHGPKPGSLAQRHLFSDGGISRSTIPVSLCWHRTEAGELVLAWNVVIRERGGGNDWEIRISTADGVPLDLNNWTVSCQWDAPILPVPDPWGHDRNVSVPEAVHFFAANDYHVYDLPVESPQHGGRSIVNSPWDRAGAGDPATTLQWHDDGTNNYTITRGNNVYAYEDLDGDNLTTGNSPASGTLDFNFPLDLNQHPHTYTDASVTNLFFWNNSLHDILYLYGFDEPSGNFQENNMGRGGAEADLVHAHGQDGGGSNNANFSTPPDGQTGRMQMYLWNNQVKSFTAAPIGTTSQVGTAGFGPATFNVTAELALVNDGSGILTDGCQPFGGVAGKIALMDRSNPCTYLQKVQHAEAAGAVGAIIINTVAGVSNMNGTGTVNIPSLMVSNADGLALKNALLNGPVEGTMFRDVVVRDGSLDNGIIAHEYAHGLSTRLTGGPAISSCLNNKEQMGEGWSDYIALMATTDWSTAGPNDLRPIATYAKNEPLNGPGVREFPYSYDMIASPYDYDYARTHSSPYGNGSAWCAMLWDMTWEIISGTPPSPDLYDGTGGNTIALAIAIEAMKLQPCNPGMEDGRDALLLADKLLFGGANQCAIWSAFARRGMGKMADQGSPFTHMDGTSDFTLPEVVLHLDHVSEENVGIPVTFEVQVDNMCQEHNPLEVVVTLPEGLDYISGGTYNGGTREIQFPDMAMGANQSAVLTFQAAIAAPPVAPVFYMQDDVEASSAWSVSGDFVVSGLYTHSGLQAWNALSPVVPSESILTLNTPVVLPLSGDLSLQFWHQGVIEPTFDGGVVEISTDNGANWTDLGGQITVNGYDAAMAASDNGAFAMGQAVFTGVFSGRITRINLNAYAGQSVLIRFRFGTDTGNANASFDGWFIDDILIVRDDIPVLDILAEISEAGQWLCETTSSLRAIYDAAFPVEWSRFEAFPSVNRVELVWETATETGTDYFVPERSRDAHHFEALGSVEAAGYATEPRQYSWTDDHPFEGLNYYRIRQMDIDGAAHYSAIRSAYIRSTGYLEVYPNPTGASVQIKYHLHSDHSEWILYNSIGMRLRSWEVAGSQGLKSLDMTNYPSGIYVLECRDTTVSQKVFIQKW